MSSFVISNVSLYREIAEDAYLQMLELIDEGRSPNDYKGEGYVFKYDPEQKSFRQAMILIVFTGMWLEAFLHLEIVAKFGGDKFKQYDFKSYEDKLKLLGFNQEHVMAMIVKFRECRKELVHEKAHFDAGSIRIAQKEAENARNLMVAISEHFEKNRVNNNI